MSSSGVNWFSVVAEAVGGLSSFLRGSSTQNDVSDDCTQVNYASYGCGSAGIPDEVVAYIIYTCSQKPVSMVDEWFYSLNGKKYVQFLTHRVKRHSNGKGSIFRHMFTGHFFLHISRSLPPPFGNTVLVSCCRFGLDWRSCKLRYRRLICRKLLYGAGVCVCVWKFLNINSRSDSYCFQILTPWNLKNFIYVSHRDWYP